MRTIHLTRQLPAAEVDALAGTHLPQTSVETLIAGEDTTVYKPDGTLLLVFRHAVLPVAQCQSAYPVLRHAASKTDNRGLAGGLLETGVPLRGVVGQRTRTRYRGVKRDGTLSNTNVANVVESGIIGYFDRGARFPYCRQTAYNMEQSQAFLAALPLIQTIDRVFQASVPERYAVQAAIVAQTHPDFVIPGTVFTTVTVNRNWQTAVHQDKGDYGPGFGVLTAFRAGTYSGCHFVFPAYGVGVDLHTGDLLLCDVHEWHGNTPLVGEEGAYERISLVLYYRANMVQCGSAAQERERAKRRRPGTPLHE